MTQAVLLRFKPKNMANEVLAKHDEENTPPEVADALDKAKARAKQIENATQVKLDVTTENNIGNPT